MKHTKALLQRIIPPWKIHWCSLLKDSNDLISHRYISRQPKNTLIDGSNLYKPLMLSNSLPLHISLYTLFRFPLVTNVQLEYCKRNPLGTFTFLLFLTDIHDTGPPVQWNWYTRSTTSSQCSSTKQGNTTSCHPLLFNYSLTIFHRHSPHWTSKTIISAIKEYNI